MLSGTSAEAMQVAADVLHAAGAWPPGAGASAICQDRTGDLYALDDGDMAMSFLVGDPGDGFGHPASTGYDVQFPLGDGASVDEEYTWPGGDGGSYDTGYPR